MNGRPFSVEFNGNILIPVDYKKKAENVRIQGSQNGGKGNRTDVSGSQMSSQRGVFGTSQRGIFFGSQRGFLTDSNRGFFFESQNGFSFGSNRGYLTGSNREFWTSSNRPWMYEWEYENGSQRSLSVVVREVCLVQVNVEISLEVKVDFGGQVRGIPFWKSAGVFDR